MAAPSSWAPPQQRLAQWSLVQQHSQRQSVAAKQVRNHENIHVLCNSTRQKQKLKKKIWQQTCLRIWWCPDDCRGGDDSGCPDDRLGRVGGAPLLAASLCLWGRMSTGPSRLLHARCMLSPADRYGLSSRRFLYRIFLACDDESRGSADLIHWRGRLGCGGRSVPIGLNYLT